MLRIAIVEDNLETACILKSFIDRYAKENKIDFKADHFNSAEELLENYQCQFELLLLDIHLAGMNGMLAAEEIRKRDEVVNIIFITSLAQYAVKGYEVRALDFVVKPVSYYQFSMKLDKAVRIIQRNEDLNITITVNRGIRVLSSKDVTYIEVSNHDLIFHTHNLWLQTRGSLSDIELKLAGRGFLRISVCYLVNLKYLSGITGNTLILTSGEELVISRSKKKEVLKAVAQYLGGNI